MSRSTGAAGDRATIRTEGGDTAGSTADEAQRHPQPDARALDADVERANFKAMIDCPFNHCCSNSRGQIAERRVDTLAIINVVQEPAQLPVFIAEVLVF